MLRPPHARLYLLSLTAIAMLMASALPPAASPASAATSCTLGDGNISLTVLAPTPNQVVTTSTLPLQVIANGYRLDARFAGTPVQAYVGHYHEILDGNLVDMTPMRDANRDTVSMVGPHRARTRSRSFRPATITAWSWQPR